MVVSNTYTNDGTYTVSVTVTNGCGTDTYSEDVTFSTTGLNEAVVSNVKVYPNPNNGAFIIEVDERATIDVYDLAGRQVVSGHPVVNQRVNFQGKLDSGRYLLQIRTSTERYNHSLIIN
jgi:hypothetical protein